MPVETKNPPAAEGTPKKKSNNSSNALAKVTLLDGSTLDVNISVSILSILIFIYLFNRVTGSVKCKSRYYYVNIYLFG